MFVMTAKISKPKLIAAGVILVAVVLLIVLLATSGGGGGNAALDAAPTGATNDERVAFLATFGWSVNAEPTETQKVKIPEGADNKVFSRYNELQLSQGFDLSVFAGKEAMRYVYEILNYPDAKDPVYASVLVYEGHIIGGDVTNSAPDGTIHGFTMPTQPSAKLSATEPTETSPESSDPTDGSEPTEETNPSETSSQ